MKLRDTVVVGGERVKESVGQCVGVRWYESRHSVTHSL